MAPADGLDRRARGAAIEVAARAYQLRAGLRELARNANYRGGDVVVFVEVRYRNTQAFGGGAVSVDARKRHKLVRAAQLFLLSHPRHGNASCRFDVVEAEGDPRAPTLRWLRDAFRADD
jgi:putative endonuclease